MEIICTPNTTILQWTRPGRSTNSHLLDSTVEMQVSMSRLHSTHLAFSKRLFQLILFSPKAKCSVRDTKFAVKK